MSFRQWLLWYEYKQSTVEKYGIKGSKEKTIRYFTDLYAVRGGKIDYPIFDYAMQRLKQTFFLPE